MSAGVSERRSEKRRGRPRHPLLARFDGRASYLAPDVKTERGRANRAYAVDAMSIVDHADDPALAWIVDADAILAGTMQVSWSLLTEIGRLAWACGDEYTLDCARALVPTDPVGVSVARLRRWRAEASGRTRAPLTSRGLTEALRLALNRHLREHAAADDWRQVASDALRTLAVAVLDEESDS